MGWVGRDLEQGSSRHLAGVFRRAFLLVDEVVDGEPFCDWARRTRDKYTRVKSNGESDAHTEDNAAAGYACVAQSGFISWWKEIVGDVVVRDEMKGSFGDSHRPLNES